LNIRIRNSAVLFPLCSNGSQTVDHNPVGVCEIFCQKTAQWKILLCVNITSVKWQALSQSIILSFCSNESS